MANDVLAHSSSVIREFRMELLVQFLLRLAFGLAVGMAITSPRDVSSGFFRNHLYVALGLATLASLASYSTAHGAFWYAVGAAAASYIGSMLWLYDQKVAGRFFIVLVALLTLAALFALFSAAQEVKTGGPILGRYLPPPGELPGAEFAALEGRAFWMGSASAALTLAADVSSGLVLGVTLTAMLLGHWYLNSPTMELAPLRRLLLLLAAVIVLQAAVAGLGLAYEREFAIRLLPQLPWLLLLRWSFGIFGAAVLLWMAWQTLKIPNTQSATGILFVAVIATFIGELSGLLLSAESLFPL
jgi:hypothetical protein